jgi:branched-chain amino acid transport system substrate-binding protein
VERETGPAAADPSASSGTPTPDSLTRGFLFADLRDYTRFVETHGAVAAAELLLRYRGVVREAVARYRGAEIKTEGDSFYVVFGSVSNAVQCGLAIIAATRPGEPGEGIAVGVGVHAGETVETPEGYVGAPVNIAARICALAKPGQVLVSDTVRALTASMLSVTFAPVGRRPLKGVREPLMLYVATASDPAAAARAAQRRRRVLIARAAVVGAVVVLLGTGAVWYSTRPGAALPAGPWTIAIQEPLAGDGSENGQSQVNGVKLAVDELNAAGGIGGVTLKIDARDEGKADDANLATESVKSFVADPKVIALVGPQRSPHARIDIPITNEAGLLQCSAATTNPELTKPGDGALDLRKAFPARINFVRLATADDIQGPAMAAFAFNDLRKRLALIVDDTSPGGRGVADAFQKAFAALEPSVASQLVYRRALNPGTVDFSAIVDPIKKPERVGGSSVFVYFGGFTDSGGPELKRAADAALTAATSQSRVIELLSWDGLYDGSGADQGSYIQAAGPDAERSYATRVSIAPVSADFDRRYRAAFGQAPTEFSGAAYACTEIVIDALRHIATTGVDASRLREAIRAYVTDATHRFDTVLGNVGFDANGDSSHQYVTFYKVDTGALGGKGDWIVVKQQDFGPAP